MDARRAAKAAITSRAYAQGDIAGLDDAMTRRLIASTVYTESNGGDLQVTNRQGYVGRYQAGAQWLADAGYIDGDRLREAMKGFRSEWAWAEAGRMTRFLEDSANWREGLDLQQYKSSSSLQDEAFKRNSDAAFCRALEEGLLHADDDPKRIAGFLKARHIAGYGGAKAVLQGKLPRSDSNGTSNYDYYNDIARNRDGLDQLVSERPLPQRASQLESHTRSRVLQHGAEGHAVRDLQRSLHNLGFTGRDGQPLRVDGDFGANTESAVRAFQRDHGLHVDGVAGKDTLRVLALAQANPFADKGHPQHALYTQALAQVHAVEAERGIAHGRHSENLAGSLTVAAVHAGLQRIDRVEFNREGCFARAVQVSPMRDEPGLNRSTPAVDTHAAIRQPLQASSQHAGEILSLVPAPAVTDHRLRHAVP